MYRTLRADRILETAERLAARVRERFPESSLAGVAAEIRDVAGEATRRCEEIARPNVPLAVASRALAVVGVAGLATIVVLKVRFTEDMWRVENFIAEVEAGLGALVFLGAAVVFLVTIEQRIKRRRVIDAITELRALAHVVDMHQLTKDPEHLLVPGPDTASSPERTMTPFELSRYLDYSSEILSLLSKVAALYVEAFPDSVTLGAVDEIENLTSGLSRKIWQKMMVLDRFVELCGDGDAPPRET